MSSLCIFPLNSHNNPLRGSALLMCPFYTGEKQFTWLTFVKITRLLNSNSSQSTKIVITHLPSAPAPVREHHSGAQGVSIPFLLLGLHRNRRSWDWCFREYMAMGIRGWGWSRRPLRGTASVSPGLQEDLEGAVISPTRGPCGLNWY